MTIQIDIPTPEEILSKGTGVGVALRGNQWLESQLGPYAKDKGVYVIHHTGRIKYVGMTEKPRMSFGMRLRREFTESGSQGRHIYPKLALLQVPPKIQVSFFSQDDLPKYVRCIDGHVEADKLAAIFEMALKQTLAPEFQS